jgi:segregation and condensation protein B
VDRDELTAVVEAFLLTSRGPITAESMVEALSGENVEAGEVAAVLEELAAEMGRPQRGVRLEKVAGGWRCVVPPTLDPHLRAFHGINTTKRLSQAALEVLAIVSHRQPVTLPEINFLRGTNSSAVVKTLLDRKLVRLAGRKKVIGKPFLYRTTREFLVHFGLDRIEELPDPEELIGSEPGDEG